VFGHAISKCPPGAMQPNHRVVGREAQLARNIDDGASLHIHAFENSCVLWLQRGDLREDAPAIDRGLDLIGHFHVLKQHWGISGSAELIDRRVASDTSDPRVDSVRVAQLRAAREGALECELNDVFHICPAHGVATHKRHKAFALVCDRILHVAGTQVGDTVGHVHEVCTSPRVSSSDQLRDATPEPAGEAPSV
jgi:hypothetical protein